MPEKRKCQAVITQQTCLAEGIYSMWLAFSEEDNIVEGAVPGQFISMYSADASRLLPRPISICETDRTGRKLRVVYRVAGKGTAEFARMNAGEKIPVIGPLGNGYTLKDGKALVIGGGIGIPPLLQLSKGLSEKGCKVQAVLGYRDDALFLKEEFETYADVYVSTEDGSAGTKGNVMDAVRENALSADMIYSCGPLPMLRGVQAYAKEQGIQAQISLEERMACGIGACLACVCETVKTDGHSHVKNARVCKDGPVFDAGAVRL